MIQTGVLTQMATGPTPITGGRGFPTKISAGQRIITVAGPILPITAGYGFPEAIWIGVQHGFPGELVATMWAGRLCPRAAQGLFMSDNRSACRYMSCAISDRNSTISAMFVLAVSRCYAIASYPC